MDSIKDKFGKIKRFFLDNPLGEKIVTLAIIFLVGIAAFGLGRLSIWDANREKVRIEFEAADFGAQLPAAIKDRPAAAGQSAEKPLTAGSEAPLQGGFVVASKNSDKYHFPWCSGAKRIKEENKIYFASAEEAKAAGYSPAAHCKGLK